ncbi:insulinase family protein [Streptomyces profundus]|nr:insulinase family protein [Streptomyces sp. MA3_2.13]
MAHLYEHLYLATLRAQMTAPLVAHAQTHADTMDVSATVLADADRALLTALTNAPRLLAEGRVDDDTRVRECRAIDVELSEWFGNPLLIAGHKLAALATRRPQPARFDDCRIGSTPSISVTDLRAHAALRAALFPERVVIVGPRPAEEWQHLTQEVRSPDTAPAPADACPGWAGLGSRGDVPGAASRVFIGIPLQLSTPDRAEAVQLTAELLMHERGPLAGIGHRLGVRFRGGSLIPTAGCAVIVGSWTPENARQREAIGVAVRQYAERDLSMFVAAQAITMPERRRAAAATSATLATAVDGWQAGCGIDPTAARAPSVDEINHTMWAGWDRSVLVGATSNRCGPFQD